MSEKKTKKAEKQQVPRKGQLIVEFDSFLPASKFDVEPEHVIDPENVRLRLILWPDDDSDDVSNPFAWGFEMLQIDGIGEPAWYGAGMTKDDDLEEMIVFETMLMRAILAIMKKGPYAEK